MASRRAKQERLKQKQQVEKTTKHKQYQQDKTTKDNVFVLSAPLGHLFVVVTRETNVFVLSVLLGHLFVVVKN